MTNFTIQTLLGLPTFCLGLLILVLAFGKNKLRVNNFFIYGSLLAIAQFIGNEILWFGNPGPNSIANYSKIPGILFSPVFLLFLYGVSQTVLESRLSTISHRQSVFVLLLLSLITFGFYAPFWYVKNHVRHKAGNFLIVIFAFCLTVSFYIHVYLYTESSAFSSAIWLTVDMMTIVSGIVNAMNLRAILLKEYPELEIDPVLTFLFGIFYLQHQLNQMPEDPISSDPHTRSA